MYQSKSMTVLKQPHYELPINDAVYQFLPLVGQVFPQPISSAFPLKPLLFNKIESIHCMMKQRMFIINYIITKFYFNIF